MGKKFHNYYCIFFQEDVECNKYASYSQGLVHISQKMQFKLEKKIINNIEKVAAIKKNYQQREGRQYDPSFLRDLSLIQQQKNTISIITQQIC
ncbi:unnamed protein product [Paramecium pentaurelia]|uniref:Uncharacterized protein n=1 Tax=Paramecium pentaurelia TaxID=43138 RepID=A0A8S1TNT9_9CILI|nr:unnamed protein product [Paramecium pentaurelia]